MARTQATDFDEKRSVIKRTACNLFATRGFHGTSIVDIAKKCNISKSNLYHYFESKEDILYELLHDHAQLLIDMAKNIFFSEDVSSRERLMKFTKELLDINVNSRDQHAIILSELDVLTGRRRKKIASMLRGPIEMWIEPFCDLNPELKKKPELQFPAVMMFIGMVNWTHTWFAESGALSSDDFAKMICDTFLNGFGENQMA